MPEQFRVRVTKDHLVFSAAHFITFNGTICERLHGHNWRVAVEVRGELDENYYVFDFIALRDATQELVNQLDHRVLLPTKHHSIRVTAGDREVEARFEDRRWVFPAEDALLRLGARINRARRARLLTQADLASKSGVSLSTMAAIESGSPTVQIGFYMGVLFALDALEGLDKVANLADDAGAVDRLVEEHLPKRVRR